jgi:hypothetical protein
VAGGIENPVDGLGSWSAGDAGAGGLALDVGALLIFVFLALGAHATNDGRGIAGGDGGVCHAHDAAGNFVCLGFEGIAGCADLEFGLDARGGAGETAESGLVAAIGKGGAWLALSLWLRAVESGNRNRL